MPTSADRFGQAYEVIPLHQVLFAELGEWAAPSDLDSADLAAYRLLAEESRTARAVWIERSKAKKTKPSECEAACDAMIAAEAACLDPLYNILHRRRRSALCFSGGGIRSATFSL